MRCALMLSLLLTAGCGSADSDPTDEPGEDPFLDTSGDEEIEAEPAVEPEPEPAAGPARLTVSNRVDDEDGGGTVQVLDEQGQVLAEGSSGDTFDVTSGTYRVRGTITDADLLIDTPTHEHDELVTVPPGETVTAQISFPVAHVRLVVRRGNRDVARWELTISREGRQGGPELQLSPSRRYIPITPGRYSGTLTTGDEQIEVSGLIFQGGARMTVPINVN